MLNQYESTNYWVRIACLLVDAIGSIIFFPLKLFCLPKDSYDPKKIKRIVIFRLDGLGDLILSTAALREIRCGFPEAHITLVVSPWAADIVRYSPFFDKLVIYDSFFFHRFRESCTPKPGEELRVIHSLRAQNFDLGIDLRGDFLSLIPLFLSNCRYRFATATRGGRFLLTNIISYDHKLIPSQQQKNLEVLKALGIPANDIKLEVVIDPASKANVNNLLANNNLTGKKLVVMMPCALYKYKSWPAGKFAQLALDILEQSEVAIILIGTQEQQSILADINKVAQGRLINLAGKLTILEVAAILEKASLCICNDSGLMHLAAAFERPLIQLFGPGPPEPFGHYYPQSTIIQETDCSYYPCTQRQCKNQADWCMDKITVAEVLNQVKRLLPT